MPIFLRKIVTFFVASILRSLWAAIAPLFLFNPFQNTITLRERLAILLIKVYLRKEKNMDKNMGKKLGKRFRIKENGKSFKLSF